MTKTRLDEPRAGRLNIQYGPADGEAVTENPPRFTWLPVIEDGARYVVRLSQDPAFADGSTLTFRDIPLNFFTPEATIAPGDWHWSYAVDAAKGPATNWSETRAFTVADGLPKAPLPRRAGRWAETETAHPRLWLQPSKLETFRETVAADPTHCAWETFRAKSVEPWRDADIMTEPAGYPGHERTASVWRATYIACQELIYAIRHMAIGGQVLQDDVLLDRAKAWLLEAASWDPSGTTSRAYTDEWAFRVNVALAWGYDWLHDHLTEEERAQVGAALLARTRETAQHVMRHANIHLFPFDSHAVRAVSAVLVPASLALLHDEDEATGWLDYSVEFLWTVYSPWGDAQGGWAEGTHYWMTGMAYLIEAANLLKSYAGLDLYQRPFFRNTGDFPLYTKAPETRRATFGDDATQGDRICLKMGYNVRQFAGVTGNGAYQWYHETLKASDPGTEREFYNWGWWDFPFDDMTYLHDFGEVEPTAPDNMNTLRWFKGIGWVAIQHGLGDPAHHIQFNFKSSPYGSISHSHGDQNAFCLHAFGEDLAISAGYYVAFNSSMHRKFRRQTLSKNAILIDGRGQYAEMDKARAMRASGRIVTAEDRGDHIYMQGDATDAYRSLNEDLTRVLRDIHFVHDQYFVIVDTIDADRPVTIDWLLHANGPMELGGTTFRYTGERAGFYGQFLWSEGGAPVLGQETGFPVVDPTDYEGLPVSTALQAKFPAATRHRIATLLVPYPLAAPRRVFNFLDDQGYDCDLYFTDADERSFKVTVPKSFDVGR